MLPNHRSNRNRGIAPRNMLRVPLWRRDESFTVMRLALHPVSLPEVRHVGRDERELAGENLRRLGQAAGSHGHFMRGVVLSLLRQCLFQQRLSSWNPATSRSPLAARGLMRLPSTGASLNRRYSRSMPFRSFSLSPAISASRLRCVFGARPEQARFIAGNGSGPRAATRPVPD